MIKINCSYCRKENFRKKSRVERNIRNYCDIKCYNADKHNWIVSPTAGKKRNLTEEHKAKLRENVKKAQKVLIEKGTLRLWTKKEEELLKVKFHNLLGRIPTNLLVGGMPSSFVFTSRGRSVS